MERAALLDGYRFNVIEGKRIEVKGTLRVIDHPARAIGMLGSCPANLWEPSK
jgi:hypothetical protein